MRNGIWWRVAGLLATAVLAGCGGSGPSSPSASDEELLAEVLVGPEGGTVGVALDEPLDGFVGARLVIPAGALARPVTVIVRQAQGPAHPSGDVAVVAVHIDPSGTQFAVPARLTLQVAREKLDEVGWLGPELIQAMTYSETLGMWVPLRMTEVSFGDILSVTAELDSLSFKALVTPLVFPAKPYDDPELQAKRPVVLVHGLQADLFDAKVKIKAGLGGSTKTWGGLSPEGANYLAHEAYAVPVYELRYYSHNTIESNACAVQAAIRKILAWHPGQTSVDVIAHSLGGLVTRAYTEGLGQHDEGIFSAKETCPYSADARVNRLLTLATPHGGSDVAKIDFLGAGELGWLDAGDQLQPGSKFLQEINSLPLADLEAPAPEYKAVLAGDDAVVEGERASLVRNLEVPDGGHADTEPTLDGYGHMGADGIANITSKEHAAYPVILNFLGIGEQQCLPQCAGKGCGGDGCGGTCGSCGTGSVCGAGQCEARDGCRGVAAGGRCEGDVSIRCADGELRQKDCGQAGLTCGWYELTSSWECLQGDGGSEPGLAGMALVPAGTFTMGAPESELKQYSYSNEAQRAVTLTRSFYMQRTEVTQAQWNTLVATNPAFDPAWGDSCGDECPIDDVTWWDALAYANALSSSQGLGACYALHDCVAKLPYPGAKYDQLTCETVTINAPAGDPYECDGYRLPTEAEWEYAYRAWTTTAFYSGPITDFSTDPNIASIGWYFQNADLVKHAVGQKAANPWGLYDMAGNVWEWCWDWYGDALEGPTSDPTGPDAGLERVARGGGWLSGPLEARAAYRGRWPPGYHDNHHGFRLARSLP